MRACLMSQDAHTDRIVRETLQLDIERRSEIVRISETAISLHEERIAGHRHIIAVKRAEITRLQRALREGPPR